MLDRYGRRIEVAWAQHELVWLTAAMTLAHGEREPAFCDIAYLTKRSMKAVRAQAYRIECARQTAFLKTSQIRALQPRDMMAQRAYPIRPRPANSRGRDRAPADCTSHPPKAQRAAYCRSGDLSGGANA